MRKILLIALGLLCCLYSHSMAQPAVPSSIAVFFDLDGNTCIANVAAGDTLSASIVFLRNGDQFFEGVTSAEFGVNGLPAGWVAVSTPNPLATFSLGEPVATANAHALINFAGCQNAPVVQLYEVLILATSDEEDVVLSVTETPIGSGSSCQPNISCGCLSNCFTPICVKGGHALINPRSGNCTVVVETMRWENVKSLYRAR